ncbi:hydrogenase nickel (NiFe) incorporation-associated protein HypB [Photobacterium marinum]|uniref:Hydrogenase maturation factor HypB n=1 Tax=Photobacterium marinum TaxID=1056511 RepID=L8JAA1_9GAMM|nr:hydrogenase nickel incorporation protein HypB [Photobacterium marinum]ELR64484.1 hydrogenase nickel (NiFe) incorporation-associated protein HypB [Photobacterium marinum]
MCNTCNCNITDGNRHLIRDGGEYSITENGQKSFTVIKNLLHENNNQAEHNRAFFNSRKVLVINLMSSPGSGKTRLLESSISVLKSRGIGVAVIEGDLETENDADRIRKHNVPVVQITTGMACHLDAHMIKNAQNQLDLESIAILFIENVGNLVCPASFDLGQHLDVVLLSVTEGDDKPSKYPVMFRTADNVLLTKTDLISFFDDFSPKKARKAITDLSQNAHIIELSSKSGYGMSAWFDWLESSLVEFRSNNNLPW